MDERLNTTTVVGAEDRFGPKGAGKTYGEGGVPQFLDPVVNQTLPWVQRYDLGFYEMIWAVLLVAVVAAPQPRPPAEVVVAPERSVVHVP